jgi:hypothetical protein
MNNNAELVAIAIEEYFPKERYAKHAEWLKQGKLFEEVI